MSDQITPSALKEPVLRALGILTNLRADVPVRCGDVVTKALEIASVTEDTDKASRNANYVATQVLRKEGLLGSSDKRGFWSLSGTGVAEAATLLGTTAPTVDADDVQQPVPDDHQDATPSSVVRSPWADDEGGVTVYTAPVADTYSDDAYIRSLAISQTRCYGNHDESSAVCGTCPLVASCRSSQMLRLATIAAGLRKRDAEEAAKAAHRTPGAMTTRGVVIADDTLEEMLAQLEHTEVPSRKADGKPAAAPPNNENGVRMAAQVESLCFVCSKTIPEKAVGVWIPSRGMRHETCP